MISILEIEKGVAGLASRDPEQAARLRRWFENRLLPAFSGKVLPVDLEIAKRCGRLHVPDPRPDRDALIAATTLVHGMTVVTRNVDDFADTGADVLNPWQSGTMEPAARYGRSGVRT